MTEGARPSAEGPPVPADLERARKLLKPFGGVGHYINGGPDPYRVIAAALVAERAFACDENRQLREALKAVRVKAIPAGAAIALHREGWETRCTEVVDIIDEALGKTDQLSAAQPATARPARAVNRAGRRRRSRR